MAENRRPSQRYLSGRVRVTAKAGLGTDRHLYLSPSDAEPNLGFPGEKSVPISGTYYRLVTIPNGDTYDRYWQVDTPASLVDGISIFDEGTLVGTANSVSKINFVGSAITATSSGSISTITVSPPGTDKQILFNDLDDFGAASQVFYDKGNNRLGIGISNPTQQLHLNGDFRLGGRIWDIHNQVGAAGSVLIAVGSGVSWTRSSGANVTVSDTAPSNAVNGDLWWDSEDGDLNVYYEDADSSAWVSANANADQEDGLWKLDAIGIHTLSNVGIGTTMASVALAVGGNAIFGGALGGTGIVTATEFHGTFIGNGLAITGVGGTWAGNSAGIHTTKNVGIGSTLPNAILDVRGNSSFTGITTFNDDVRFRTANAKDILFDKSNNALEFADDTRAYFGDNSDLSIHHGGGPSGEASYIDQTGTGKLYIRSNVVDIKDVSNNSPFATFNEHSDVQLYYNGLKRFDTTGAGVSVYGGTTTTGLSTFASVELDSTLIDIHGQVGAARSVLTATGAGVSWGRGGSGVKIDEDPPSDNYDADLWWESDTGEMHIWYDDGNSAQWVSVSQGPAGVQGAQGATGVTGAQGVQGAQGHQGRQGAQGAVGAQGVQGAQGHQGRQGAPGPQGAQGHQGVQGSAGPQGHQGVQGAQGHQGVQGAAGASGSQGNQGVQGAQGHQGHQGVQGATGAVGAQGATGAQGHQGVQGAEGNFGGVTFDYTYLTDNADSDPGAGNLKFNGTALHTTSPLIMYIDDVDDGSRDIQTYLRTIDDSTSTLKGHFRISNKSDSTDYAIFSITGSSTEASGYFKIPCTHLDGATSFSNNEDIIITFARTGNKGDTGTAGAQGAQGHQGVQGAPGAQGSGGTATINNNANDRLITGSNTAGELNAEADLTYDGTNLKLIDDKKAIFGTGNDLEIFHTTPTGSTGGSIIRHTTDHDMRLQIPAGSHDIVFETTDDINMATFHGDAGVQLYWRGASNRGIKFETTDDGVKINGGLQDKDGDLGSAGQVLSSTGTQLNWVANTAGAQGDTGATGAQGHQGVQGAPGSNGSDGSDGSTGAQGHQGHQGQTGSGGGTGAQGAQGHQGRQGAQGAPGAQGATGSNAGITAYNNPGSDRVITSHDASTIHAESNLTFNGDILANKSSATGTLLNIGDDGQSSTKVIQIKRPTSRTTIQNIQGVNAGVGAGDFQMQSEGGNVAIGNVTPTEKLHVSGGVRITGAIKDKDNSAGSSGQFLTSTGSQIDWISSSKYLPRAWCCFDGNGSGDINEDFNISSISEPNSSTWQLNYATTWAGGTNDDDKNYACINATGAESNHWVDRRRRDYCWIKAGGGHSAKQAMVIFDQ